MGEKNEIKKCLTLTSPNSILPVQIRDDKFYVQYLFIYQNTIIQQTIVRMVKQYCAFVRPVARVGEAPGLQSTDCLSLSTSPL